MRTIVHHKQVNTRYYCVYLFVYNQITVNTNSSSSVILRVGVVLKKTDVGEGWHFDNLSDNLL